MFSGIESQRSQKMSIPSRFLIARGYNRKCPLSQADSFMETEKLFIPVLLGTLREGRESEKVAQFMLSRAQAHPQVTTLLLDVRDLHFPLRNGDELTEPNPEYKEAMQQADGLIIVSPEYNHGYPGVLKMALDLLDDEPQRKALGIAGVSSGVFGGARMIEHLLPVAHTLGFIVSTVDLYFPKVQELFDESGHPKDQKFLKRADAFIDELVWLAAALRWGREQETQ